MSKVISPIIFRSKIFNPFFNKQFLSFDKKYKSISYFKFFNIYINLICLVKKYLQLCGNYYLGKYLYSAVNFIGIKVISIKFVFSKIYGLNNSIFIKNLFIHFNLYFNYFKNYKFYGNIKNFFILKHEIITYRNLIGPLTKLKFNFYNYKKFKKSVIYHCNNVFKFKYKRRFKILGIKILFSGRLKESNNRAKVDIYSVGNLSIHTISSKFYYFCDNIKTERGSLGLKIWINVI